MSASVCRVKSSFKPYQNELNSIKDTGEKGKKTYNIDLKIAMSKKILFHYPPTFPFISLSKILKVFLKTLPTKMKPTQCPGRKIEARKGKKEGGEKAKRNS